MSTESKQRKLAPSTRLRDALFTECGQRIEHAANLWLVYSTRNKHQWILTSDLQFLHFLYLEFAPTVGAFILRPEPVSVTVGGAVLEVIFDAVVRFTDGHVECRKVANTDDDKSESDSLSIDTLELAAHELRGSFVQVALADLEPQRQRIHNGLRMNRFLTAARYEPLESNANEVLNLLMSQGAAGMSLGALRDRCDASAAAFVYAAIFRLYQQGKLDIDIESGPLNRHTVARLPS